MGLAVIMTTAFVPARRDAVSTGSKRATLIKVLISQIAGHALPTGKVH